MKKLVKIVIWMAALVMLCAALPALSETGTETETELDNGYVMHTLEGTLEGSEAYKQYYLEGYALFEEGKYEEAIEKYRMCLEEKPGDMMASFEIVEAYICLGDLDTALDWLQIEIAPNLEEPADIAHWFRRQGFIAIEIGAYEAGYALYVMSQQYEDTQLARDELAYILHVAPETKQFTPEEAWAYLTGGGEEESE